MRDRTCGFPSELPGDYGDGRGNLVDGPGNFGGQSVDSLGMIKTEDTGPRRSGRRVKLGRGHHVDLDHCAYFRVDMDRHLVESRGLDRLRQFHLLL